MRKFTSDAQLEGTDPRVINFPVVGIGASAGGIQALQRFFEHLPADHQMAFVIVLHLAADQESHAAEILQRATPMRVEQVVSSTSIEPHCVYVIAPGKELLILNGTLDVRDAPGRLGRASSIDVFFRTLAEAHRARAFGVVLSGTGSDGSAGIGRIKECGGVTLVQKPEEAQYDQMPRAAIATGLVDFTVPVETMGAKLVDIWRNARDIELPMANGESAAPIVPEGPAAQQQADVALRAILDSLHTSTGHDFLHYKRATVLRRIERRLQVNMLHDLPAYAAFLEANPDEPSALLKDLLIGVTNFFRDAEPFATFEKDVVPALFANKPANEPLRIWVTACSTGQEVYSIAMLLCEEANRGKSQYPIQLFATDIDETAIHVARAGAYSESIQTDVSPERLNEYFVEVNGRYIVKKSLREKVLFAAHNLLRDPPFSRLDLVTCRNLLIYLDKTVQRQLLQTFHFALEPGGFLFLGNAESADIAEDLFTPVDKKNRIYRSKVVAAPARRRPLLPRLGTYVSYAPTTAPQRSAKVPVNTSPMELHRRLLEEASPPSILVDRDAQILHASDGATAYLRLVGGEPTRDLLSILHLELRVAVQTAIYQAFQKGGPAKTDPRVLNIGTRQVSVQATVRRFEDTNGVEVALLTFNEWEVPVSAGFELHPPDSDAFDALNRELERVKEQLQDSIEHASVTHEELKAANEELQSIVEEMRSSGEELETSKEELQSLNEELLTTNSELQFKVAESDRQHDDIENLIASTGIATIFVDSAMRIMRYTAPALKLFRLIATDVGRPLLDLVPRLDYPNLESDIRAAFEGLRLVEQEVAGPDGQWYLARLQPYRTQADYIGGVVLTFIDITARKAAQEAALESDDRLKLAALATDDYAIIVQDTAGIIVSWNKGATRVFGYEESEALGQSIDLIFTERDIETGASIAERELAKATGRAEDERWHLRKGGVEIYCSGVMTPIRTAQFNGYAKIARDLTGRKSIENQQLLQLSHERTVREQAEAAVRLKDEFFAVLSHELKNPLNLIHVKAELLHRSPQTRDIGVARDAADAIQRSVLTQSKIIDDLLDLSRIRTGKLSLQMAPVDLARIVRAVGEASALDAEKMGLQIEVTINDDFSLIYADAVRVEQLLWNLMRNAIKFTPPGGQIALSLLSTEQMACIEVADTGQGISADFMPNIFDMFSQSDGVGRSNSGGLGIGLSVVKQVAEMHGGRIEIASDGVGKGTRCRLWLPKGEPAAVVNMQPSVENPQSLQGVSLLLVDDAAEALEALKMLLETEGATVATASNGKDGLLMAQAHRFNLIVSDIGMPTMDGYAFVAALRSSPLTAQVPAIALTGFGRKEDAVKALRTGFNAHIGKPAVFADLLDAIRAHVQLRRQKI